MHASGPAILNLNPCVIATHNGVFHADDILAVATLDLLCSLHAVSARVVRTRDPGSLATADVVVDVGGEYDASRRRYDHHQKGRAGERPNGVLYSSFGLVWRDYGRALCDALGAGPHAEAVAQAVDRGLVQPIDATDNGQDLYEGGQPVFPGVAEVSLSSVLSGFNPSWHAQEKDFDAAFAQAVGVARAVLRNAVDTALGEAMAKAVVAEAIAASEGGPIVVLNQFAPWGDQVRDEAPHALFCVFPSETGTWMVQAVNAKAGTFESRRLLPESWAGLRDGAFSAAVDLPDGVFCHPGRFICGAKSKASALRLAELALL